ncbi:MAG: hypothetical protein M3069_02075 [Chloroflexota bacterium]|nr:hypothetical protein [Chloroflexota bacterium]
MKELPATTVAYTTTSLRQSIYPGGLAAYDAISQWITTSGHTVADDPRVGGHEILKAGSQEAER